MSRKIIHTDSAPKAIGPYSQAVAAGGMVFLSGQISLDRDRRDRTGASGCEARARVHEPAAVARGRGLEPRRRHA